ncbi:UDP-galactose 4-epimerase [Sediminihabitans luteus]|uniref:UDP-glucose 4-epimerase n=1 Tax=Sediminihabitans luteus TaxID=1138585 RepID=A0A2M9D0B5_9CELL|nr:UDP-glucose 4-epimerase GalE [Sediminihabitans luteus]PJJ77599.1 UDP-galactose 4-epimerase [Sediminihabitans luteus]GII98499.1 UDP-glucose 4-epimerase GalE [Sediminihabitans luteus]
MTILVTGGAGYIGAHVVRLLQERGDDVVVVDDLSTGRAERVEGATLVEVDVSAPEAVEVLERVMRERAVTAVVHFAGRKQVGESVERPAWYYQQNVGGFTNLVTAMESAGVDRLVFSSSATLYGNQASAILDEKLHTETLNPYGETKLAGEWLGRAASRAWGLRFVALRYFNVAGAGWPELGDPAILNLVPMVLDRLERGERPKIFGDDYPTADGTCVRDYVHVLDLAHAHLAALDHLGEDDRPFDVFNVGTGTGSSVREVIEAVGRASGLDVTADVVERRPGDPARLVASVERIEQVLGWRASYALDEIVASAWEAWQQGPRPIDLPAG